jgi:hypothetical protein
MSQLALAELAMWLCFTTTVLLSAATYKLQIFSALAWSVLRATLPVAISTLLAIFTLVTLFLLEH